MSRLWVLLTVAVLLARCAGSSSPEAPPQPRRTVTARVTVRSNDDLQLQAWRLDAKGRVRGHLVVIHGLKDYSERYLRLAQRAADQGYQVFGLDLRGHGRSPGDAAYVEAFTQYVDDVSTPPGAASSRRPYRAASSSSTPASTTTCCTSPSTRRWKTTSWPGSTAAPPDELKPSAL